MEGKDKGQEMQQRDAGKLAGSYQEAEVFRLHGATKLVQYVVDASFPRVEKQHSGLTGRSQMASQK